MTAVPSLLGLGVKRDDINVIMLRDHGVDLYANVLFTTPAFAKQHPDAVRGFRQGDDPVLAECRHRSGCRNRGAQEGRSAVGLRRSRLVRLKWALDFVVTPAVRQAGIGNVDPARLSKHIDIVTEGFQLARKLPPEAVFDPQFLPPAAERQIK